MAYALLAFAIIGSVVQASLEKAGAGRVEWLPDSTGSRVLVFLSIPLNLLSNIGVIIIVIWSFFVLPWPSIFWVLAASFVGGSLVWGTLLAALRRSEAWGSVLEVGVPLVLFLRLLTSGLVVLLALVFLGWLGQVR